MQGEHTPCRNEGNECRRRCTLVGKDGRDGEGNGRARRDDHAAQGADENAEDTGLGAEETADEFGRNKNSQ